MRILVIFTGGTIGSRIQGGWISPDDNTQSKLLCSYRQQAGDTGVQFTTVTPYTILSENLSAHQLNQLIACLDEEAKKGYDGIIVTHGTDTLQYTAAALGYAFGDRLPILLVSADYPLDDARSNGLANFTAAVNFLLARPQGGVYVSYQNAHAKVANIHLATRLLAHAEMSADLYSLGTPYAMVTHDNKVTFSDPLPLVHHGLSKAHFCQNPPVLILDSRPETAYPEDLSGYKAILLSPYHSGTLNVESERLQAFCRQCKQSGIPLFLVNAPKGVTYASAQTFDELGIIPLPCTKIAAFVKCWLAVSQEKEVKDFVLTPLYHEFLD